MAAPFARPRPTFGFEESSACGRQPCHWQICHFHEVSVDFRFISTRSRASPSPISLERKASVRPANGVDVLYSGNLDASHSCKVCHHRLKLISPIPRNNVSSGFHAATCEASSSSAGERSDLAGFHSVQAPALLSDQRRLHNFLQKHRNLCRLKPVGEQILWVALDPSGLLMSVHALRAGARAAINGLAGKALNVTDV